MTSILKSDKTSILKKRYVSHSSVKIEAVQEPETNAEHVETRNESFFESVWPGLTLFLFLHNVNILQRKFQQFNMHKLKNKTLVINRESS